MSTSVKSIRITCQGAATLPIDELVEFQGNLKKLSKKNLEKLKARILEDGFNVPFFVWDHDGTFSLLDGHQRMRALTSLKADGYEIPALPVAYIEAADIADARKKLLAISSQYGEFDSAELSEWLDEIGGEIAETLRLVDTDIPIEVASEEKEVMDAEPQVDKADELNQKWQVKQGDVWQLGDHRLMCGDSTKKNDVEKLMNGIKADMVFTDPPYGVDYEGINNDSRSGLEELLDGAFSNMMINSKEGASVYCFHSDRCADIFHEVFRKYCHFSSMIIWKKQSLVLSQTDYQSTHEPCMYGWFNNGSHNFFADRKQTSVWEYDRKNIEGHTTPKPVELIANALKNSSRKGELVIDLFGGSGSTLLASEQTGRKCYSMELDPKYCAVILQRYFDVTGNNPKKVV